MTIPEALADVLRRPEVHTFRFPDDGTFSNNPHLPVLLLRGAVRKDRKGRAPAFERLFRRHDWRGAWQNGVFSYHHYHSTAHEVLGVAQGGARLKLGGPDGKVLEVEAGDAVVLPAGVAHKNLGADPDFLVVGAYPAVCPDWDVKRGHPGEQDEAVRAIESVPRPDHDPVYGADGPLVEAWDLPS